MLSYHQIKIQAEARQQELLQEAQVIQTEPTRNTAFATLMVRTGSVMVAVGEWLQDRYDVPETVDPCTPEPAPS
jgi:hypothetical protein